MLLDSKEIPHTLRKRYEFYDFNHAFDILNRSALDEWNEILQVLDSFSLSIADIKKEGGSKSEITKKFDAALFDLGWRETKISGELSITEQYRGKRKGNYKVNKHDPFSFIDGHNIDFVKGIVAVDFEWNSKDQTYDRDLLAFRTYHESRLIDVGIIITRAKDLDDVFNSVYYRDKNKKIQPIIKKYGKSTTLIEKLLPRLSSRRNGGCPILAIGINNKNVIDWTPGYVDPLIASE